MFIAAAMYIAEGNESFDDWDMFDVIVGMHRLLASQGRAGNLGRTIRDHLVHVHVELRAATGHPYMYGEHVAVLVGNDFIAHLNNQSALLLGEPFCVEIHDGSGLFQHGVGTNHLSRDQRHSDIEVLERALGLSTPKLVSRYFHYA